MKNLLTGALFCILMLNVSSSVVGEFVGQSIDYKLCPEAKVQNVDFSEINITPFPLQKGKKADFEITGTAKVAINQKYIQIAVYQSGKDIYNTHVGGPATAAAGSTYDYSLTYGLPSIVPKGTYELHMSIIGSNGDSYGCFLFDVVF